VLQRIEWSAILAVLLSGFAFYFVARGFYELAYVTVISAVMWAILSLKERT
jgi:hypothetical protein